MENNTYRCPRCGASFTPAPGMKFCGNCGQPLVTRNIPQVPPHSNVQGNTGSFIDRRAQGANPPYGYNQDRPQNGHRPNQSPVRNGQQFYRNQAPYPGSGQMPGNGQPPGPVRKNTAFNIYMVLIGFALVLGVGLALFQDKDGSAKEAEEVHIASETSTPVPTATPSPVISSPPQDPEDEDEQDTAEDSLERFGEDLQDKGFAQEIVGILHEIGFVTLEYKGALNDSANYEFKADGTQIVVTAFSDDRFLRIFEPHTDNVFYEDGEIKKTKQQSEDDKITFDDMITYQTFARLIVGQYLKYPDSASYPYDTGSWGFNKKDGLILATSTVTSLNDYGQKTTNTFVVEFYILDEKSYAYQEQYVQIGGEVVYGEAIEME